MNLLQGQGERRRDYLCLALLWVIVTSYNLFKAYHIDDTAYLEIGRWISAHPFHPMSGLLNWNGVDEPIYKTNQPHLFMYLIAVWSKLFGFSEPAMHSLESLASLLCIFLFYRLARFFAPGIALWLTAILILGPAFIVEQNLMVDVPLLAAWLAFFCFLACGIRSPNQTLRYLGAAIACSAALLIKYSSLLLIPILCLSLLLERRAKYFWAVLVPIATLAAWSLFNYLDYGAVHILTRPEERSAPTLDTLTAWILTIGGVSPVGLIAAVHSHPLVARWSKVLYSIVAVGFAVLVAGVASGRVSTGDAIPVLWWTFLINGSLALFCIVPASIRFSRHLSNTDGARAVAPSAYLVLWIVSATIFYVLFAPFIAARHVLLILPPILLIAGARWRATLTRDSVVAGLALTIIVSTGLCVSDWRFADFERSEAQSLRRWLPRTRMIWTSGHWGWQWYAELAHMQEVDVLHPLLQPGDYLVVAQSTDHQPLRDPPPMHLIRTDTQTASLYDLFCPKTFYYTPVTLGPWFLSRICRSQTAVFQVDSSVTDAR